MNTKGTQTIIIENNNRIEYENKIMLIIEGLGTSQSININENLTVNNIRAYLGYETTKYYNIIHKNKLLKG